MDVAEVRRELQSQAVPPECLAAFDRMIAAEPGVALPQELLFTTAQWICNAVSQRAYGEEVSDRGRVGFGLHSAALAALCAQLTALELVLARVDPATIDAAGIPHMFGQLEAATNALAVHGMVRLLLPRTQLPGMDRELQGEVLRLPVSLLVRCVGIPTLTSRELLGLAQGDVATAVAIAVSTMRSSGSSSPPPQLQLRVWQVLCHLSTPQCAAELLGQVDADGAQLNDTPIMYLLDLHVAHAHRLALCLVQFDAFEAAMACAENPRQRSAILGFCLRIVHNLVASPHLWAPGRIIARRLAVLWPKFGIRLLAPHFRRLLGSTATSRTEIARSTRELRRDLRTLGWVLHHAPELRAQAGPLCAELAMKVAHGDQHSAETLAVAVGAVANAGLLTNRNTPLFYKLNSVDAERKQSARLAFPSETGRLWVVRSAWDIVEELGYWPQEPEPESTEPALGYDYFDNGATAPVDGDDSEAASRRANLPFSWGFLDADPDDWEFNEQWQYDDYWDESEPHSTDETESWDASDLGGDWYAAQVIHDVGPLGLMNISPPEAPPAPPSEFTSSHIFSTGGLLRPPTALLCEAPDAFRCSIDGSICREPVISVATARGPAILYDRANISAWLSHSNVCPVTGDPLTLQDLHETSCMAEAITSWSVEQIVNAGEDAVRAR